MVLERGWWSGQLRMALGGAEPATCRENGAAVFLASGISQRQAQAVRQVVPASGVGKWPERSPASGKRGHSVNALFCHVMSCSGPLV